ncbi:MAG: hypothetical protein IT486_05575 [Gammaproteobacteria bacterium]|nr:hypothetical protein [Gammaproteobacteria bacterium]
MGHGNRVLVMVLGMLAAGAGPAADDPASAVDAALLEFLGDWPEEPADEGFLDFITGLPDEPEAAPPPSRENGDDDARR